MGQLLVLCSGEVELLLEEYFFGVGVFEVGSELDEFYSELIAAVDHFFSLFQFDLVLFDSVFVLLHAFKDLLFVLLCLFEELPLFVVFCV